MENFDWVAFLFYFAISWAISKALAAYLEAKNQQLAERIDVLKQQIDNKIIDVKIEKHGEVFYLFDKKNDTFIAQGTNMEELKQNVDARFKNSKVVIANDDELISSGLK